MVFDSRVVESLHRQQCSHETPEAQLRTAKNSGDSMGLTPDIPSTLSQEALNERLIADGVAPIIDYKLHDPAHSRWQGLRLLQ